MIVGAGAAFAIGFGAVTVLLLALHAEVRRLAKLADGVQKALAGNLRQILVSGQEQKKALSPPVPAPVSPSALPRASPPEERAVPTPPLVKLVQATESSAGLVALDTPSPPQWNPDRRLLVMRLASRGKQPDQIAAALRIPQEEVELFLEVNRLVPSAK